MESHSSMAMSRPSLRQKSPCAGRPKTHWSLSKQKKLTRLYFCLSRGELGLEEILSRLNDDKFTVKKRTAHKQIRSLLRTKDKLEKLRPQDNAQMRSRVRFLRSARAERRMARRRPHTPCQPMPMPEPMQLPSPDTIHDYPPAIQVPNFAAPAGRDGTAISGHLHPRPQPSFPWAPYQLNAVPMAQLRQITQAKRHSWTDSIMSSISSLARSSSSTSARARSTSTKDSKDPGATSGLGKLSPSKFLSLLKKPQAGGTAAGSRRSLPFRRKYSRHKPTDNELNQALFVSCCSQQSTHPATPERLCELDDGLLASPGCVHKRLFRAIGAQHDEKHQAYVNFYVTDEEANAIDQFGNTILHVAARWRARVSILLMILKHTTNITAVNDRGETFLHVFNPPSGSLFKPSSFLRLVRRLMSRGFDFCQRDAEKRNFLHYLVERQEFPLEALYYFFKEVSSGSARFLVAKRSESGERLWHCVCRKLDQTRQDLSGIFGDEQEFVRRYLPEFYDIGVGVSKSSQCGVIAPGHLHALSGSSSDATHPSPSTCPSSPTEYDIRGREKGTGRTRLMALLHEIGSSGREEDPKALEATVKGMLDEGASLRDCDREGNNALQYAAEFGILPAVKALCKDKKQRPHVNHINHCGNTALRLIKHAIQRTDVRSDIHMEAQYLQCAAVLLDAGAIDQSALTPCLLNPKSDGVWDGTDKSVHRLLREGLARDCRGLHLKSPLPRSPTTDDEVAATSEPGRSQELEGYM